MANTESAEKRHRQSQIRNDRNRARKSALRTAIKKVRAAVEAGDSETAKKLLPETLGLLDRTASRGVIHRNQAARSKSRLSRAVDGISNAG
ncbi:MAG TPA: 30S ribosomal protein S20 [Thermoanaerobaculia bacterium]|nr:30S ribosomal protein S20 [Thermoanaerobaculia bacterium]